MYELQPRQDLICLQTSLRQSINKVMNSTLYNAVVVRTVISPDWLVRLHEVHFRSHDVHDGCHHYLPSCKRVMSRQPASQPADPTARAVCRTERKRTFSANQGNWLTSNCTINQCKPATLVMIETRQHAVCTATLRCWACVPAASMLCMLCVWYAEERLADCLRSGGCDNCWDIPFLNDLKYRCVRTYLG